MPYMKAENEVLEGGERVVLDIAVVGGGIAGLAAAIAFRRTGHKVTVSLPVYRMKEPSLTST